MDSLVKPAALEKRMSDEVREHLSAKLKISVDPPGTLDTVTIVAGSVLFGISLLVLICGWINRAYPPIRAKNLRVVSLMYIGAVLWFVGDIAVNGHVDIVGVWSNCKLWCLWVRLFFAYTFSATAAIRTYALYRVFILHRPYRGFSFYLPIIIVFACLVIFCLVSQVVADSATVMYLREVHICTYVWAFRGACLGLLWCIWFVVLYFVYQIRNIHSSFNERYESFVICLLAFTAVANTTFLHALKPNYPLQLHYRMENTWIDFIVANGAIWTIVLYPCLQCLFNRDSYLQEWTIKLRADGLGKEYNISQQQKTSNNTTALGYSMMNSNPDYKTTDTHLTEHERTVRDSFVAPMEVHLSTFHRDDNHHQHEYSPSRKIL
ncbi:hypothetical protein GGI12_002017 [Dipsacomyces acuminosporus]|nr:hypothetical protein GGI12_002017 [Dipsacomyces acuminosporus]